MKNIYYEDDEHKQLQCLAEEIIQRTMTRLLWTDVYLISAEAEVTDKDQLQWLANYIRRQCNRIVVLGYQSEFTHLIVAKSNDIQHLYANEIIDSVIKDYGGESEGGDAFFAQAIFVEYDVIPQIIDQVVEKIVVDLPYR